MKAMRLILALAFLGCLGGCKESRKIVDDYADEVVIQAPSSAMKVKLQSDIRQLRASIQQFHGRHGRYPESLQELARMGTLPRIPKEPLGGRWIYDPVTGQLDSSSDPDL